MKNRERGEKKRGRGVREEKGSRISWLKRMKRGRKGERRGESKSGKEGFEEG